FFFSSRRRHTRFSRDWSSDVCSSDLADASSGSFTKSVSIVCSSRIGIFQRHLVLRRKLLCVEGVFRKLHSEPVAGRGAGEEMRRSEERRVGKRQRSQLWADG